MGFFSRKKNEEGQKAPAKSTAAKPKAEEKKEEAAKPATYVTRETTGILFWLSMLGGLVLLIFMPEREKQVQIVERKLEPVLPIEPKWATVGVWNATKREEHRVGLIQ